VLVSMMWHTFPRISALIECQSVLALKSIVLGIDIMPGFRRKNCSNCSLCMPACTCVCYEYCTLKFIWKICWKTFLCQSSQ
jgi:hypothetical protein